MPDQCPKCGKPLEAGDVKCPACGVELPDPSAPPPPQKAAVLMAAMLPVVFVVVFVLFIGGMIFAGLKIYRATNKASAQAPPALVAPVTPAPVPRFDMPAPVDPNPSPAVSPPQPQAAPFVPAPPPVVPGPVSNVPLPPSPLLTDFVPQMAPAGSPLVLRGQGLAAANVVQFISTQGAHFHRAEILQKADSQVIVNVPKVSFENDAMCVMLRSRGGMAVMIDQHMGATPWGTDGHLHGTAVIVRQGDEIDTHDNMVIIAREGSVFSVGDHSIAFLEKNVTVRAHGRDCRIYYVAPVELAPGVTRDGLNEVPSLQINSDQDAFREKPAPPDADQ